MKKFDLTTVYNIDRPLSWSAISSFQYNPRQWHHKYVVHGKCTYEDPVKGKKAMCFVVGFADPECPVVKKTPELAFGSLVDKRIQDEPDFLPDIIRFEILQHEMRAEFDGVPLIGIADTFKPLPARKDLGRPGLRDYKTGRKKWDQQRADETGQLTLYSFLLYLTQKINPAELDLFIDWLPTHIHEGEVVFIEPVAVKTFATKRTMADVLRFGREIKETWKAMQEFAERMAINPPIPSSKNRISKLLK